MPHKTLENGTEKIAILVVIVYSDSVRYELAIMLHIFV